MVDQRSVTAIIQARMGSSRLPGKVLIHILGKPLLSYILERLNQVDMIGKIVVATSLDNEDDEIALFCDSIGFEYFRGKQNDVLDRFFKAAKQFPSSHFLRITGDCPLVDPETINDLLELYFTRKFDYCAVATGAGVAGKDVPGRYPDGLDAEIFSFRILQTAWEEANEPLHREHVTPFIWQQPKRFKLGNLYPPKGDYSQLRWTVDKQQDLEFIDWVFTELYSKNHFFNMNDILDLIAKDPQKATVNRDLIGKEGYEQFWS